MSIAAALVAVAVAVVVVPVAGAAASPPALAAEGVGGYEVVVELAVAPAARSQVGEVVTLTVDVSAAGAGGGGPVTGEAWIFDTYRGRRTRVGRTALEGGTGHLATTGLGRGRHRLEAQYLGDASFLPGRSPEVAHEVGPDGLCPGGDEPGAEALVRRVYLRLLRRCPDGPGLAHWVASLDGGTPLRAFALVMARTPEARGLVVDEAYQVMLGRRSDAAGRAHWVGRLGAHGRYDHLLADLAGSAEFWALSGGTREGFVARVYGRLLHRSPEQAGLAYWTGQLGVGVPPRALVLGLARLPEPLAVVVVTAHHEILERPPTADELAQGVAELGRTGDRSLLHARLIASPELAGGLDPM